MCRLWARRGSVKTVSPASRGRSAAESLDRPEASPTIPTRDGPRDRRLVGSPPLWVLFSARRAGWGIQSMDVVVRKAVSEGRQQDGTDRIAH